MAYGLWLYKEISTPHGEISLHILKRDYNGAAIEIAELAADGIHLKMDGDSIDSPIIGSNLTINIIDTGQIDTAQFFTPDATLYRVELYKDIVLEWSGYLTPDSYQESLDYRDIISLIARDNLGRLEEFTIKESNGLTNIKDLVEGLLVEVECPMQVEWHSTKLATIKDVSTATSCGYNNISIDTRLFLENKSTYREMIQEIFKGLGWQLRYIGTNKLGIYDISALNTLPSLPGGFFIENSGYQEILPAWRSVETRQDYGVVSNFFTGQPTQEECTSFTWFNPGETMPDRWEGVSKLGNQWHWNQGYDDGQERSIYIEAINLSYYLKDDNPNDGNNVRELTGAAIYKHRVRAVNNLITITMGLNNTLRRNRSAEDSPVANLFVGTDNPTNHITAYQLRYGFLVGLRGDNGVNYIMTTEGWRAIQLELEFYEWNSSLVFTLPECKLADDTTWNQDQEVSINIQSIPVEGELLLFFKGATWDEQNSVEYGTFWAKVSDITFAYADIPGELTSNVIVDTRHNITASLDFRVGQVPSGKGDRNAYWGGVWDNDGYPLSAWTLNKGASYPLSELVIRENIHLHRKNYQVLSGKMMSDSGMTLGRNVEYKGKIYTIVSAAWNVLQEQLDITSMQEVEPYVTLNLTYANSPLENSTGSKLGSGKNEFLQFSNDAGNAKRLYELDQASQEDMEDSYVIIDKSSMSAAKRVPLKDVGGLFNKAFKLHYNEDGVLVSVEVLANLWTNFGITAGGEGTDSGGGTGGATSLEGLNDVSLAALVDGQSLIWSSTLAKWINKTIESGLDEDALSAYLIANNYAVKGDIPSSLKSPYKLLFGNKSYDGSAEVTITAADLGALTEHQDISHLLSKEDAAANYQVKGNYLTGITSKMVTDALTYTPLANTTKYALSDSVGGDALNSAKLGGQLPSHYATATSVTKVSDDLSTFKTLFDSMFEKKDGKIHAKLTLWTDYALVAGGEGDGTGGGGGGLTSFSVIVNNKTYNSNNGTATITEQLQPLITTNNKLAYFLISGTPTSLPASDVYDWAKKSSLAASDVPDLSGKYLSTSGGTIDSDKVLPFILKTSAYNIGLQMRNSIGTKLYLGWSEVDGVFLYNYASADSIGVKDDGTPYYYNGTYNTLYHTGNFNPANYLPLSGGTISSSSLHPLDINTTSSSGLVYMYFKVQDVVKAGVGYYNTLAYITNESNGGRLGVTDSNVPQYWEDGDGNTRHTLIHSGNIGSYTAGNAKALGGYDANAYAVLEDGGGYIAFNLRTNYTNKGQGDGYIEYYDSGAYYNSVWGWVMAINGFKGNADSATKLQTARTIWGNSFDGTGDIAGNITLKNADQINGNWGIAINVASGGLKDTSIWNGQGVENVRFKSNGNVLIGSTSDNGNKFQIHDSSSQNNAILISTANGDGEASIFYKATHTGYQWAAGIASGLAGQNVWSIYSVSARKWIFAATTSGVEVNGNISASGNITAGTASDRRLKDNICTINQNQAIEVLMALNPITFIWNKKATELGGFEGLSQGFIAQEYESLIPNSGRAIWGEYRAIDYTKAIPYIVSVEQNHEQRIKEMVSVEQNHEQRIKQLEEELKRLRREYYGI